jgi:hypothetical protein
VAGQEAKSDLTLPRPEFNEGLDWVDLLRTLPDPATTVVYTTYLDAPSFGSSARAENPVDYVAPLARRAGMSLGGENTGSPTSTALRTTLLRARRLRLRIVSWFDEANLVAASRDGQPGPTFADLGAAARSDL